jgi:hypothetical protein
VGGGKRTVFAAFEMWCENVSKLDAVLFRDTVTEPEMADCPNRLSIPGELYVGSTRYGVARTQHPYTSSRNICSRFE